MTGVDLYQAIGGTPTCRQLSAVFYARVARDPVLRPFFPGKTLKCAIEEFSAFLAQLLGGPSEDAQRRWWLSLRESHMRFKIGPRERDAWMNNMLLALDDVTLDDAARTALREFFDQSSAYVVNVAVEEGAPPGDSIHEELSRRWRAQRALDEAVAALHGGAPDHAIALAEQSILQGYFTGNRSVYAAFLAQMIRARPEYVRANILADPALAREHFGGRTLLHAAAAAGNVALVESLLRLGVDPNITDAGGHTPLYWVANGRGVRGAVDVVRVLILAGANVDADNGVKRCTPLHMAARRGNVEIASALLDYGAALEARDSLGETPLRRAVNCGQTHVAKLLLKRGADKHSKGSKGLTPLLAARTIAMQSVFQ